jgi:hypothetical protein
MSDPDAVQHWRAPRSARQIEHDVYLASPEWRLKRKAVLDRCHYVCEGCGTQSAVEVHHLSYAHWKNEFLFELVGLCAGCHARVHGIEAPEPGPTATGHQIARAFMQARREYLKTLRKGKRR